MNAKHPQEKQREDRPILYLDFDGAIHRYDSRWQGATHIPDHVTDGFFEWAEQAAKYFRLVVFSSRSSNPEAITAMQLWLVAERQRWRDLGGKNVTDAPLELEFVTAKPPAFLTIDDRCVRFTGSWSELNPEALIHFRPWNKPLPTSKH